ncbi:MAG: response regulator transcription factor [Alphaproteobacteria bacterium]|nr:response regulator transcription factor [Alphaproteobacteria bacterium]
MKFLVADDHELFLRGLELVLSGKYPRAKILTAGNYLELYDIIEKESDFDVILTDLAMPGDIWNNAIAKIHNKLSDTPIIILSAIFDEEIVQKTIEIGVSGYLSKTSSHQEILDALDVVISGGAYFSKDLLQGQHIDKNSTTDKLLLKLIEDHPQEFTTKHLTPRQKDVLEAVASGKSNKQIAYELGLTEGTVKLHLTAIFKILGVYNRMGAVLEATRLGLIYKKQQV